MVEVVIVKMVVMEDIMEAVEDLGIHGMLADLLMVVMEENLLIINIIHQMGLGMMAED